MNKKLIRLLTLTALLIGASAHAMETPEQLGWQLLDAAQEGDLVPVQKLLQRGVPVDATDSNGWTPLVYAACHGNTDICRLLLDHGASVGAKDKDGWTPLMITAYYGHTDVCQLLLDHGASVDATDNTSETHLGLAARYGHTDTCQLLIERGASVDAKDENGWTPLMYAAHRGGTDICKRLLDHGASVDAKDENGRGPLWHAVYSGHTNVYHLLIDTIVTQIKNSKANAIVLLGLRNRGKISCLNPIDKNVIRLIARKVGYDSAPSREKQQESLFAQINAIENDERKQELMAYAQKKLNTKSTSNLGNSDE